MFRRLHYRLTGLCALITMGILFLFTALYLLVSEHTLRENNRLSFQHDFDTLCSVLEQQSTLTGDYLLQLEAQNGCLLFLWDRDIPLLFNSIRSHADLAPLAEELHEAYQAENENTLPKIFSPEQSPMPLQAGITMIYTGQSNARSRLQAVRSQQGLVLLVLAPQDAFLRQLYRQRLLYVLLSLSGCILLTLFAFLFTGRLIKPIRENQERQLQFVSNASHELRTPLAVILSSAEIRAPGYEQTIAEEALRMSHLVDEMLTLTGLESRSRKLRICSLETDTFLLELYEQSEPLAAAAGLHLLLSLPQEELPNISADKERLKQLLLILLQNALSYTPAGGTVTLKAFSADKFICFQVVDNGIGIDDLEKEKIFERFYRSDSSRHDKNHFGLGLSLAREIVLAHKGRIEVSDTPGGGSTFSCYLPV